VVWKVGRGDDEDRGVDEHAKLSAIVESAKA
jgi:hypothetical protein